MANDKNPLRKILHAFRKEKTLPAKQHGVSVRIDPSGKAVVTDLLFDDPPGAIHTARTIRRMRSGTVVLFPLIFVMAAILLFFAGSGSEEFIGERMGKSTAAYQKIDRLSRGSSSLAPPEMKYHLSPDEMLSLALPSDFKEETLPSEDPPILSFRSADGGKSALLQVTDKEQTPTSLRILHRLTLESMTAELGASILSESFFFVTRGGNDAFNTLMEDGRYDYGIVTATSPEHFVTLILSTEHIPEEDDARQKLWHDLTTAVGCSIFLD